MKTDDRDERLAAALDDVVAGVRPEPPDPGRIVRRGSRRRIAVISAAFVTTGVFVGAVGLAATQLGRDADGQIAVPPVDEPIRPGWITRTAGPGGAFAVGVSYPKEWKLHSYDALVIDSNTQPILRLKTSAEVPHRPACGGLAIVPETQGGVEGIGSKEAVIWVHSYTGGGWGEPLRQPTFDLRSSRLAWSDAIVRTYNCFEGPFTSATFFVLDGGRWIFHVTMGPDVLNGRVGDRILDVLDELRLPEDPSAPIRFLQSPGWATGSERGDRYTPASAWTANAELPTQESATFPGIEALPEDGVLITAMQIGNDSPAPDNPNFSPAGLPLDIPEQVESSWEGYIDGRGRSRLDVVVNGRALSISIYFGTASPNEDVRAEAESALERLLVDPLPTQRDPAELPPPVRDDFRSEFVSAERGYRFWPRSGRAERGVIYRFVVPHCGLGWLVDFDGSFWEGRSSIFGNDWIPADAIPDGDIGTIEYVGHDGARYEASDGTWTLLSRVDGPVVRQPCD